MRKERMPPEHLRRVVRVSRSMHPSFMGAMKYMPHALHNLLRAMPMPWEAVRYVDVLYHVSGLITFVTEKRREGVEEYRRRWSAVSRRFSSEKKRRGLIRSLKYPVFDDDDEITDFGSIVGLPVPRAIESGGSCDMFGDAKESYLFGWRSFSVGRRVGFQMDSGPYVAERPGVMVMGRESGHERVMYPHLYNAEADLDVLERLNLGEERRGRERRHPVDIPLMKRFYLQEQTKGVSSIRMLLKGYTRNKERSGGCGPSTGILKELKNTRYFQRTEIDWVEAGLQLVHQGHRMLSEILRRKKLSYLVLDGNFNLKPVRTLTTKERKKSRVGTAYHLTREMLKFVKHIVDVHVLFRQGLIDAYELMGSLGHVFNNVGIVTGIYRYKYRLMRQIKKCKALKRLCEHEGVSTWGEQWRTWVSMFRGHISLLGTYINGLVTRMAEGRRYNPKPLSKQRTESGYDVALKRRIAADASSILQPVQIRRLLQHFNEAWRCWKADIPYHIVYEQARGADNGTDRSLKAVESLGGTKIAVTGRARTQPFVAEDSGFRMVQDFDTKHRDELGELQRIIDKYIGLKAEWYTAGALDGKGNRAVEKKRLGKITRLYMKEEIARQREYLQSPFLRPAEAVAVYRLYADYFRNRDIGKICFPDRNEESFLSIAVDRLRGTASAEEAVFFDKALESSADTIFKIKKMLLTQRTFRDVEIGLRGGGEHVVRIYGVSHMERLADAFLCVHLFYEADKIGLFPEFIKPGDEIDAKLLMDFCERISECGDGSVLYEGEYRELMENVDNNLLLKLLKIVVDPALADYMISRNNCRVVYKDMGYTNHVGFLKGFQFSAFVHRFYSLAVDLCVLGSDIFMDERSTVRHYMRHMDRIYVLFRLSEEDVKELARDYGEAGDVSGTNYFGRDDESRQEDVLGKYVHAEIATRLLPAMGSIAFRGCSALPIRFSMCGVDVLVCDRKMHERSSWVLRNGKHANFAVSRESVDAFNSRVEYIVKTSGSATFLKIANRWNTCLLAFVAYFREFVGDTEGLAETLRHAELQIQNAVKKGVNSKMPVRFPSAMFYSPREMGGLGMLSMAGTKVPASDLDDEEERCIPPVMDYIERWDVELRESDRVWMEYGRSGKVELDKGIPRMNTLLQKSKTMFYDRGFRMINLFRRYSSSKPDAFAFTSTRHDGKLWSLERYGADVLEALGGMESVSGHTLFGATYLRSFSKMFWEENVEKYGRLTNAQRMGLNQVPNRRFILWWSPTINRGNVYVGYQVQLELTGIFMHGKLPTLKVSFVQIFRGHLWRKIHEGVVADLCDAFKKHCDVARQNVHSRKSHRLGSSAADILLSGNFHVHSPCSILDENEGAESCKSLWVDVQLRWGDYAKRDPHRYARARFIECATDPLTKYPCRDGFVVVLDLCYNTFSAYGNLGKDLRSVLRMAMEKIVAHNLGLHILRERLRKALQLCTSEVEAVSSSAELFNAGLLADTRLLLRKQRILLAFDPVNGNLYHRSYEEEGKKPRHIRMLAAEDLFALGEQLGKRSVVVSEDMVDAMENGVIDHPSVSIKSSGSLPFHNILRIENVGVGRSMKSVDLYAGWRVTSRFTNFCRVLLVIQALETDEARVRELGIDRVWPTLEDEQWIEKEILLKNLVVDDYCEVNGIDANGLSQNEIRDIVFGFKIHREAAGEPVEKKAARTGSVAISFGGDEWRRRYFEFCRMVESGEHGRWVERMLEGCSQHCDGFRVPLNLVKGFALLGDSASLMCALIINTDPISFGLVPQFSSETEIHSTSFVPEGTDVIGIVVNSSRRDLFDVLCRRYRICRPWVVSVCDEVKVLRKDDDWGEEMLGSEERRGVFYIPEMWNYAFSKPFYDDSLEYTLRMGTPSRFYDGFSRVGHFSRFWCGRDGESLE